MKKILITGMFLLLFLSPLLWSAKIIMVDREYNLVAIDKGCYDAHLIPGLKMYVLAPESGRVKGIIQIERIERFASAGRILKELAEIRPGDKVRLFQETLLPKSTQIKSISNAILDWVSFNSFLEMHPQIQEIKHEIGLFKDEIKKSHLKFFPRLEFQHIRGHVLQEGRRVGNGTLSDLNLDVGMLYMDIPFSEIGQKKYFLAQVFKNRFLLEKTKADLCIGFLKLLNSYIFYENKIRNLRENLASLNEEYKTLKNTSGVYPYVVKRLEAKIKITEQKIKIAIQKRNEIKNEIALYLNFKPTAQFAILEPEKLFEKISSRLKNVPEGGYDVLIASAEREIKIAEYNLAKLKIRPTIHLKLGYPSYVSSYKLAIPIEGKSAVEIAELAKQQAEYLLEDVRLNTIYHIKRINTQIYYLKELLSRYKEFKNQVENVKAEYWQDRLDREEKIGELDEKIDELKYKIKELGIELLKYGNVKTDPEIFVAKKLPHPRDCIDYLLVHSPQLKYLGLEKEKSLILIKEAKAQNNSPKEALYKDEYMYKAGLEKLRRQELITTLLKSYIDFVNSILRYQWRFKLTQNYKQEYEFKSRDKTLRPYLIQSAELAWYDSLIKQIEEKMNQDLAYLNFRYFLQDLDDEPLAEKIAIDKNLFQEVQKVITQLEFDPTIREKIQRFKVLLAVDRLEVAKRGYYIKGPLEVVYTPRKIPSRGRRGRDWAPIPKGTTIVDWLAVYIQNGIIYRTPFGNHIHDIHIAQTDLEIAKIKSQEAINEEKHLKNLVYHKYNFWHNNLKSAQALLREAEKICQETEEKVERLQAQKIDLIASERLNIEREIDYYDNLKEYLKAKIDLKDRGYPSRISVKKVPLPQILKDIPRLKIAELEAEIVREKYKKALKLNFVDILTLGVNKGGIWFLFKLFPDINLIRAAHYAREANIWMEKANVDADLEYQEWLTRIQTADLKIKVLTDLTTKIRRYQAQLQETVKTGISPYAHYVELKILEDKIRREINLEKEGKLYAYTRLKTLMGLPPEEEVVIPGIDVSLGKPLKLSDPEKLSLVVSEFYPDIMLAESKLTLAYKELKWDAFMRNLKFGADFMLDFVTSRTYTWSITFTVFDLFLHQLGYYYQDKIQLENIKLGIQRLKMKKKIYRGYLLTEIYRLSALGYKQMAENVKNLVDFAWKGYLENQIPWESEYGVLKILNEAFQYQDKYLENTQEFLYQANYYRQLEKKFLNEETLRTATIKVPFLTIDTFNFKLASLFRKFLNFINRIREKVSIVSRVKSHHQRYLDNKTAWERRELERNFNLYIYQTAKKARQKELNKIKALFADAQELEYKSQLALEKIWEKDFNDYLRLKERITYLLAPAPHNYRQKIEQAIHILKPGLVTERSLFTPFNENDLYNGLTNYFLNVLRNFSYNKKEIELFFQYLPVVGKEWIKIKGRKKVILPGWWSKYSASFSYFFLLPYFEPNDINEIGLVAHYALVCVDNHVKSQPARAGVSQSIVGRLKARFENEREFLTANLRKINPRTAPQFLQWQSYIIKEIDRILFKHFSYGELENLRKKLARLKVPFWHYIEGNKLEEQMQSDIIRWMIASGYVNDAGKIFKLFQKVPSILSQIYPPPEMEVLSQAYDSVRLRYFLAINDHENAHLEYRRLQNSYCLGILLFWINKIIAENISLSELNTIVENIRKIKSLPEFQKIYGNYSLSDERYLFYQHSLIYYASKLSSPEDLEYLKHTLAVVGFLKNQPDIISMYGEIDLSQPYLYEKYDIYKLTNYTGNLTFWAKWAVENKFDTRELAQLFKLYVEAFKNKKFLNTLEEIYTDLGIVIDFNLKGKTQEMQDEIKGLISNWVLYFYLRGIKDFSQIISSLNEIKKIASYARFYNLNYNQDDIRYWFQHKKEYGYTSEDVRKIFHLMSEMKDLLKECAAALSRKYSNMLPENFSSYLDEIKNKKMHKGELQRLAEEIIYPQKLKIEEVKEEYQIGILIQGLYSRVLKISLTPYQLTEVLNFYKKEGLEEEDLIKLVELEGKIFDFLKHRDLPQVFGEGELRVYIWEMVYDRGWDYTIKYFENWLPRLELFMRTFFEQHNYYPPKRLLFSFLTPEVVSFPEWKFVGIVRSGALSEQAGDYLVINLGDDLNLFRELELFYYETPLLGLNVEDIYEIAPYILKSDIYRLPLFMATVKKFEENLSTIFLRDENYNLQDLKKLTPRALPVLWYAFNHRDEFQNRVKSFGQRSQNGFKEVYPDKEFQKKLQQPSYRWKVITKIIKYGNQKYNLRLSPARVYNILWKMREGYSLESAFLVFVEYHRQLMQDYTRIRGKEITGEVNNLLMHLAQQIYLTPLDMKDVNEIFRILNVVEKIYQLGNLKFDELLRYRDAESIYFSGLTAGDMEIIYDGMREMTACCDWVLIPQLLYITLGEFLAQPYYKPAIRIYSHWDYVQILSPLGLSSKLIPLLQGNNIAPSVFYYFWQTGEKESKLLNLPSMRKAILSRILYLKTKDPLKSKVILNTTNIIEIRACLKRVETIIDKRKRKIVTEILKEKCRR
jgi:hypothetical protein